MALADPRRRLALVLWTSDTAPTPEMIWVPI